MITAGNNNSYQYKLGIHFYDDISQFKIVNLAKNQNKFVKNYIILFLKHNII